MSSGIAWVFSRAMHTSAQEPCEGIRDLGVRFWPDNGHVYMQFVPFTASKPEHTHTECPWPPVGRGHGRRKNCFNNQRHLRKTPSTQTAPAKSQDRKSTRLNSSH